MKNTINDFLETETYSVNRGYTIHISRAPEFASSAVVEDGDGLKTLIDVSDDYDDFEGLIDAVIEKYEASDSDSLVK